MAEGKPRRALAPAADDDVSTEPRAQPVAAASDGLFGVALAASIVLASVALAVTVATTDEPSQTANVTATSAAASAHSGPFTPDADDLALGRFARDVVVGLVAHRGGPVDIVAIPPDKREIAPAAVSARISGRPVAVTECGTHCLRLSQRVLAGAATTISIAIARPNASAVRVSFELPARLPASGAALLQTVNRRMGAVRTLRVDQRLSSGTASIRTNYAMQAPDRVRLEASTGARAVLIGTRRWDWSSGTWVASSFPGVHVPVFPWPTTGTSRLLGRDTLGGVPVQVLTVFNPDRDSPAWFRLFVMRDGRVRRAEMQAPAHDMVERYTAFDATLTIRPPQ